MPTTQPINFYNKKDAALDRATLLKVQEGDATMSHIVS